MEVTGRASKARAGSAAREELRERELCMTGREGAKEVGKKTKRDKKDESECGPPERKHKPMVFPEKQRRLYTAVLLC